MLVNLLIKLRKYNFKEWIDLEDKKLIIAGASDSNKEEFPQLIFEFLSDALPIPKWVWRRLFWVDVMNAFAVVAMALPIHRYLPIVSIDPDKESDKPIWDYPGRNWYFYSQLLASKFGWTLEYIAKLDKFDAMALIQETMLAEQMDREFQWSMSEASVSYDPKTKKTKPNPLPRPYWMKSANPNDPLPIKKFKMPKGLLPVGVVDYAALPKEYQPKEIEPL